LRYWSPWQKRPKALRRFAGYWCSFRVSCERRQPDLHRPPINNLRG